MCYLFPHQWVPNQDALVCSAGRNEVGLGVVVAPENALLMPFQDAQLLSSLHFSNGELLVPRGSDETLHRDRERDGYIEEVGVWGFGHMRCGLWNTRRVTERERFGGPARRVRASATCELHKMCVDGCEGEKIGVGVGE